MITIGLMAGGFTATAAWAIDTIDSVVTGPCTGPQTNGIGSCGDDNWILYGHLRILKSHSMHLLLLKTKTVMPSPR
ncbi:hypothetical protein O9929_21405 [Vibrio lentus]|nr:hypothetical protein [Vibrio lentus]